MVMKVIRQRVCDICGEDDDVRRFRITKLDEGGQTSATVDLCAAHGEPLGEAMKAAPVSRRGRKSAHPVVSLESIASKKTTTTSRRKSSVIATRDPKDESQQASKRPATKRSQAPRKRS